MVSFMGGCKPVSLEEQTLRVLDDGIEKIRHESDRWRDLVQGIYEDVPNKVHYVKEEVRILNAEVQGQTLVNSMCASDFLINRLIQIRTIFANNSSDLPEGYPTVCSSTLNTINLNESYNQRTGITIYGYDFKEPSYFGLLLYKSNGTALPIDHLLNYQSKYQYTISLPSTFDAQLYGGVKITFYYKNRVISEYPIVY